MSDAAWPAPAKINLFLHVVGRRDDGYHLLQTVFQFLDFSDTLRFRLRDDGVIVRSSGCPGVAPDDDLVVRAARALQEHTGCKFGVEIDVEKQIPLQAGLGGGSSNAATTLVALNQLWQLQLPRATLADLGVRLGADVPIFIHGESAFAEGVGEQLTPVEPPQPWYLILRPNCAISTAEIFTAEDLTRSTPRITIRDFLAGEGHNDCLPVVLKRYPEVAEAIDWLGNFSEARMTGTGSTVFAAFPDQGAAEAVLGQIPDKWSAWVSRGQNRSSLLDRLAETE